ncbi:MAG: hypothetical protein EON93_14325 [Burkholderiales bacterium]|jgi:hypothetical protein|nr:MAG: hypothetical protein EON93_14325 [Burkholderiales bacterium]
MKRMLIATVALALGACASSGGGSGTTSAKTPADMILGKWTCTAAPEGIASEAVIDYAKGGTAKVDAKLSVNQGGMAVEIHANGDANWAFLPDGKLEETITSLNVIKGTMNGNDVPPAMIQGMIQQSVVGQKTTSAAVFSGDSFTLTDDGSGTVTSCKR